MLDLERTSDAGKPCPSPVLTVGVTSSRMRSTVQYASLMGFLILGIPCPATAPSSSPIFAASNRSQFTNGTFVAFGFDKKERNSLLSRAESVRETFQRILRISPAPTLVRQKPIILLLLPEPGALPEFDALPETTERITESDGEHLQINLRPSAFKAPGAFEQRIASALLQNLALGRTAPGLPDPPSVLVHGLTYAALHQHPPYLFPESQPLRRTGSFPPLQQVLSAPIRPGSVTELLALRELGMVLLLSLAELPENPHALRKAAQDRDPNAPSFTAFQSVDTFTQSFDSVGPTPADAERWWQLEVTTRVAKQNLLRLDGEDSLAEIEKLLSLQFLDQKTGNTAHYDLTQADTYSDTPSIQPLLRARVAEFYALSSRVHFFFDDAMAAYTEALGEALKRKPARANALFARGNRLSHEAAEKFQRLRDYRNWYIYNFEPESDPRIQAAREKAESSSTAAPASPFAQSLREAERIIDELRQRRAAETASPAKTNR